MQKHVARRGRRIVAAASALATLTTLFSVTGLEVSAGRMASSGLVIGDELMVGLRGADHGVQSRSYGGPVEQQ